MRTVSEADAAQIAPLLDGCAIAAAAAIAAWLRFGQSVPDTNYLLAILLGFFMALVLLPVTRSYRSPRWVQPGLGVLLALPGLLSVFGGLLAVAMATKTTAEFSRIWMSSWLLLALALMMLWRAALVALLARSQPRVLLLGTGPAARDTAHRLIARDGPNSVVGFIALPGETSADDLPASLLGEFTQLDELMAGPARAASELWVAAESVQDLTDGALYEQLRLCSLPVRYLPDAALQQLMTRGRREVAGQALIELNATPLDGPEGWVKAMLDRIVAALLLAVLLPILGLIALVIRVDSPGSVLFRQARHGTGGRIIEVFKFRTMTESPQSDTRQATRGDSRVTRVGSWLRRTSLDELPQLFNVLRGDMSLVGPRPHPVALNLHYAPQLDAYMQRHRVKPGITGWAQVNGCRGETDTLDKMQRRLEHDLYYIEHWSLWLDIKILARTALWGWFGPNAY